MKFDTIMKKARIAFKGSPADRKFLKMIVDTDKDLAAGKLHEDQAKVMKQLARRCRQISVVKIAYDLMKAK